MLLQQTSAFRPLRSRTTQNGHPRVFANMAFFLGLSSLPIDEATALFFVSSLVITIFAVTFLKESVVPRCAN